MTKERAEELIELYADAGRRLNLTQEELDACPDIEEILEAIHGC